MASSTTRIDSITASFKNTFGNLSAEQLNWKPDTKTWSIAQNIDHLSSSTRHYIQTGSAFDISLHMNNGITNKPKNFLEKLNRKGI